MSRRSFAARLLAAAHAATVLPRQFPAPRRLGGSASAAFDVRDYGARGDGLTDDTSAFERTIAAAAVDKGSVTVPTGRFLVTRPMLLGSGANVQGLGASAVIVHRGPGIVWLILQASDIVVANIEIAGGFSHGIFIEKSRRVRIGRCLIAGGTFPRNGYAGGIRLVGSEAVRVEHCLFNDNGGSSAPAGSDIQCGGSGEVCSDIQLVENRCLSVNTVANIACYDTGRSRIQGNHVRGARTGPTNNHGYGVMFYATPNSPNSCFENVVIDNLIEDTGGSGIYLQTSRQSEVRRNVLRRVCNTQTDETLPVAGISLGGCDGAQVEGNSIDESGRVGISIAGRPSGTTGAVVAGNEVRRTSGMGIQVRGRMSNVVIVGNFVAKANGGIGSFGASEVEGIEIRANAIGNTVGSSPGVLLRNAARSSIIANTVADTGGLAIDAEFRDQQSEVRDNTVLRPGATEAGHAVRITRRALDDD